MTRAVFLAELENLNNNVIKMGTILEESIELMIRALRNLDISIANEVIHRDDKIDALEYQIEKDSIYLIAKQQPIASDLRSVASIMKIITDIERIADHCTDISEYVIELTKKERMEIPENLINMIDAMKYMVTKTIDSFVRQDIELAKKIIQEDDKVDDYFESIKQDLAINMQNNSKCVPQCIDYLMIIKYLERMADHATNIAGWIQFIVIGDLPIS